MTQIPSFLLDLKQPIPKYFPPFPPYIFHTLLLQVFHNTFFACLKMNSSNYTCSQCHKQCNSLQGGRCINCRASTFNNQYDSANFFKAPTPPQQPAQHPQKGNKSNNHKKDHNAICKYFLDGHCKNGSNCQYSHDARYLNKP